jgi:hypothetical protein
METPITKERLQNFRRKELQSIQSKRRLEDVISHICKEVERMVSYTAETQYVYRVDHRYYPPIRPFYGLRPIPAVIEHENIFPQIMERLKLLFPDCVIRLDAGLTYILIDWS